MYTLKVISNPAFTNTNLNSNADNIHQAVARIPNLNVEFNNYPILGSYEANILDSQLQIFGLGYDASNSSFQLPMVFIPDVALLSLFDLIDPEDDFKIRDISELETAFRDLMLDNGLNPNGGTDEPVSGGGGNNGNTGEEPENTNTGNNTTNNNNQDNQNGNGKDSNKKTMLTGATLFFGYLLINSNR